ncbi:MAG TPA: carboxy terminal-processing peptidase [Saprospiraceae bacterium]|nr:carboxy terminal-processing peptidase [Saprospiraceae bacterium]
MRIWIIAALTGLLAYIGLAFYKTPETEDKEKLILEAVVKLLNNLHFRNLALDDAFSHKLYDTYLDRLDGMKRFLTIQDLDLLDDYEDSLDNALQPENLNLEFFNISYDRINKAVEKTRLWYPEILNRPFDFTIKDSIETDGDKRSFAKNDAELKEFWRTYLKFETLTRLNEKIKDQEEMTEEPEGGKKSVAELEVAARADVKKDFDKWFDRLDKVRRSDRFEMYLNSITNVFDPHSDYFNPKEKEDFDINMSGRLEGIGARLQMDGDFTKVVLVIPGGPAWKQKELEVDDKIFKVRQENQNEPVDVTGWVVDEVVGLIRGPKGTMVTLTVRKPDGTVREITITRDEVILDEGFAKSAIMDLEGQVGNIGYIYLPKFYADFENPNGRSCAQDVAVEVEKLMKANVKGIILDLRNNSGGSLNDVVQMSGLFIKDGPIVQVVGRNSVPTILKDKDEQVLYTGPLVVMVNTQSASASEILAAALQDYGRAVIVGGRSTFGKGSVQRFFDLDKVVTGQEDMKPLGDVKLTLQKFYRINGGSTQLRGVTPDINLPDNQEYIDAGEKELDYPMEWTEIEPIPYSQEIYNLSKLDDLKRKSEQRVAASPVFEKIEQNAKRIKQITDETVLPLQLDQYRALDLSRDEESKAFKKIFGKIDGMNPHNLALDLPEIQADSSKLGRNQAFLETLGKDVYLEETLHIMKDMVAVNHKS